MSYKKVEEYCDDDLEKMAKNNKEILKLIGEDPDREGLAKTPMRVAKAVQFMTQGYKMNAKKILDSARFKESVSEMVIVKDIELYSMCEHHMLPFFGKAHIAYIPNGYIVGLSKLARVVDVFARRLQVQERMTTQILGCNTRIIASTWSSCSDRGKTFVHDDARGAKTKFCYNYLGV